MGMGMTIEKWEGLVAGEVQEEERDRSGNQDKIESWNN